MTSLARVSADADRGAAVLFDVDGVLVDSYAAYHRIWDRWALHHSLDPETVWTHTHGRRPIDTIAVVAPHLDAEAEYHLVRDFMADEPLPCGNDCEQAVYLSPRSWWTARR
ncbi:hypothetical protein [Micromonospora sp. NPDC005203]|uniref:hypothetical protein n=1 Tax=Micromonospora sp. NPDC005203 TaxID=3364226 RepID=UPI0036CE4D7A